MSTENLERKIFYGGPIITINDRRPFVQAVGISGEKILSIGNLEHVKNAMGESYTLINLNGKTMMPGFIDCHVHPIGSLFYLLYPNFQNVKKLEDMQEVLKNSCIDKDPNELVLGFNLDEEKLENPTFPTIKDLDEACPDNPVFIFRHDFHKGVGNSKFLKLASITPETASPEGGEIQKNDKGELTGVLIENATNLVFSVLKLPKSELIKQKAMELSINFAKFGITSIHGILELDRKGGVENLGGVSIPILKLIHNNILQNFYGILFTANPKKILKHKKEPIHQEDEYHKFKIGGFKAWIDGSFGSYSASLHEPYSDQPNNSGYFVINEKELYIRMKNAHNLGLQIAIHAIGDKGNDTVVELFQKLLQEFPREDHRHRIEHASMLSKKTLKKMNRLKLIASCQPVSVISEIHWLKKRLGERCEYVYPFKSIIKTGIIMASSSDFPVEDPNPMMGIHAMVNRENFYPNECTNVEEALKTYTINGAYAAFEEKVKGSIEEGKLADLIILDQNPFEIEKEKLKEIEVIETIIRGKSVFRID